VDDLKDKIKMAKKFKGVMIVTNILLSLLILVALIDVLTVRASIFNGFSLLNWIAFGSATAELVFAWIVGVVGSLTLVMLLIRTIMSFVK